MTRPVKGTPEYWAWRRRLREAGPKLPKLTKRQREKVWQHESNLAAERDDGVLDAKPSAYRLKTKRRA